MQGRYTLAYPTSEAPAEYQPGACNIGPAEIRRRWLGGHLGTIAAVGLLAVLLLIDAPPIARLIVAVPAAGAAIGYLQAYLRFCAAFGLGGIYNFGSPDDSRAVIDSEARARDRRRALAIVAGGAVIGFLVGVATLLVP
jgi:hypothetical protein